MSTGPPIPEIQHFQNLTLKIQGQCHTWRPHSRYNTLSTHITFVRCRWALTFLSIAIEKFDLENSRSRSWLRWTLKVTPWVQHSMDSHPFRSMSIGPPIPEIKHFQNLTLKIQGQGQMTWCCTTTGLDKIFHRTLNGINPSSSFSDMRSAKSGPDLCQIWQVFGLWANPYGLDGQMTMTVHNYRPRKFHRTSNHENPSSGYRDMGSASLAAARLPARPNCDNTPPAQRAEG